MFPVPLVWATLEPEEATAVQATEVMADGNRSVTAWSTAVLGPALLTTMVYVVLPPGTTEVTPLLLVMDRSDCGVSVSVSVALLLSGLGSVTPDGGVTVAVLVKVPVAEGSIWTVKVKVTLALTGRSTVVDKEPVPLLGPVTVPPLALAVDVQLAAVTPAGRGSDTLAPVTSLGPLLLTTMVYVVDLPGTTDVTSSVLVMDRSAWGVRESVSLALLFDRLGSNTPDGGATCTRLVKVPVAAGSMVPVKVMVPDCPVARLSPLHTRVDEL